MAESERTDYFGFTHKEVQPKRLSNTPGWWAIGVSYDVARDYESNRW
jgi:hypothetical protein